MGRDVNINESPIGWAIEIPGTPETDIMLRGMELDSSVFREELTTKPRPTEEAKGYWWLAKSEDGKTILILASHHKFFIGGGTPHLRLVN